jgi:hypothetical protein
VHNALAKTLICGLNSITFATRYLVVMEFTVNRQQWLMTPTKADLLIRPGGSAGVDGRYKLLPGENLGELFLWFVVLLSIAHFAMKIREGEML